MDKHSDKPNRQTKKEKEQKNIIKELFLLYKSTVDIKERIILPINDCSKTSYVLLNKNWLEKYKDINNYIVFQNHIEQNTNCNEENFLENLIKGLAEKHFEIDINKRKKLFNLEKNDLAIEEKNDIKSKYNYPYNFVLVTADFLNKILKQCNNLETSEIEKYYYEIIIGEGCLIMQKKGVEIYYISLYNDKNTDYFYNNYTDYIIKLDKIHFTSFIINNIKDKTFINFLKFNNLNEDNNILKISEGQKIGNIYFISNNGQPYKLKSIKNKNNDNFLKDVKLFLLKNKNKVIKNFKYPKKKKIFLKNFKILRSKEIFHLYINSILLCLYNIEEFKESLLNNARNNHGKLLSKLVDIFIDFNDENKTNNIVNEIIKLISQDYKQNLNLEKTIAYIFESLTKEINENKQIINEPFQYDPIKAKEYFDIHKNDNCTFIQELFYNIKFKKIYCGECKLSLFKYSISPIINYNLVNEKEFNISQYLINIKNKGEIINRVFHCNFCGKDTNKNENNSIIELPKILIIAINGKYNNGILFKEFCVLNIENQNENINYKLKCFVSENLKENNEGSNMKFIIYFNKLNEGWFKYDNNNKELSANNDHFFKPVICFFNGVKRINIDKSSNINTNTNQDNDVNNNIINNSLSENKNNNFKNINNDNFCDEANNNNQNEIKQYIINNPPNLCSSNNNNSDNNLYNNYNNSNTIFQGNYNKNCVSNNSVINSFNDIYMNNNNFCNNMNLMNSNNLSNYLNKNYLNNNNVFFNSSTNNSNTNNINGFILNGNNDLNNGINNSSYYNNNYFKNTYNNGNNSSYNDSNNDINNNIKKNYNFQNNIFNINNNQNFNNNNYNDNDANNTNFTNNFYNDYTNNNYCNFNNVNDFNNNNFINDNYQQPNNCIQNINNNWSNNLCNNYNYNNGNLNSYNNNANSTYNNNQIMNYNNIYKNANNSINNFINNNFVSNQNQNNQIDKNNDEIEKNIFLLFVINCNGNQREIFLDANDNDKFQDVLDELYQKYDWLNNFSFQKILYKKKEINTKETIKKNGLKNNAKIYFK